MNFFKSLLEPVSNETEMAHLIIRLINAKISKTTLQKEIEEHPEYPSLLSISDVFTNHGIENIALKIDTYQITDTSGPFITQLYGKEEVTFFSVVREKRNNTVDYFDPEKHNWITIGKDEFVKKITGIVLLVGKGDRIFEKDYDKKIKAEKEKRLTQYTVIFCIPILSVALGIFYCFQNGAIIIFPFLYLLLTIIGGGLAILLIWYELDKHNPALNQICTAGKKINCGSILLSGAAKIAGLSWSSIGLSYFTGLLLLLIFGGLDNKDVLFILSWGSALTLPYLIFSIYYQWIIVKQWCILCLSVLTVLGLQTMVSTFAGWHTIANIDSITPERVIQLLFAFVSPLIVINVLIPALQKAKEGRKNFISLQKLKNSPHLFNALLKKQKAVTELPENLGIFLGNPNGKYKIIKVCNPYCGPCADAHQQVEELMEHNEDIQLQILFTATNDKNDIRTPPVKHFLALADKYDQETLKLALDDWYFNDTKNYDAFAAKYPVSEKSELQDKKIEMMKNWCDKIKIEFTPTFFISISEGNNDKPPAYFQMPVTYTVNDLKYLFLK
ncbi:vitamin K epoxide reductase family protein [Pedobacter cryoconitis]|uniref:Putative membrane protein n=1 Tax=Pedobacter cryoconitis TaxID=188932 RepID=A0A327SKS5_9SPHI|nr:vitamin K epoxide reductase family protein [Pedobacter cryoconitis]RAJ29092.1 putative membrane protein [Pedobacter cryoconitis]